MKARVWIAASVGGLAVVALVASRGFGAVAEAFASVGWLGVLAITAFHLVPLVLDSAGWVVVLARGKRLPLHAAVWIRWIGQSVNNMLPVAQVGGELVKARLASKRGIPGAPAMSSVLVDLTLGFFTQVLFALSGVALLLAISDGEKLQTGAVVFGCFLALAALAIFALVQRAGLLRPMVARMGRMVGATSWKGALEGAASLDDALARSWSDRRALFACAAWRFAGWIAGTGEVWIALRLLGSDASLLDALVIESLGQAARGAGFAIPGGLGVQEGGYLLAGQAVGLAPETGLAISLLRRVREVLLGLPGLLAWHCAEGKSWVRRGDSSPEELAADG